MTPRSIFTASSDYDARPYDQAAAERENTPPRASGRPRRCCCCRAPLSIYDGIYCTTCEKQDPEDHDEEERGHEDD